MEHEEGQCPGCGTAWVGNSGFAPVEGTFPSRNATACAVHRAAPALLEALEQLLDERFTPQAGHNEYKLHAMLSEVQNLARAAILAAKGD
ncbi:hypothetical protein LCGC14_2147800 [marine sediment metagenome]|uniref:Uncharacterized protein n=1 Tax=marine sediment metagenome TaxID=412755 RepID=A0A0F9DWA9_9ZZZZ